MDTALDILYEAFRSDTSLPEERAILKREENFLNEMERRMGQEDFYRLWDVLLELGGCRAASDFRLGFWLGANLIEAARSEPFPQK